MGRREVWVDLHPLDPTLDSVRQAAGLRYKALAVMQQRLTLTLLDSMGVHDAKVRVRTIRSYEPCRLRGEWSEWETMLADAACVTAREAVFRILNQMAMRLATKAREEQDRE